MTLRAVQQFVLHLQSFRNIDLWYQGAYLLRLQLYIETDPKLKTRIYAHPFAHTHEYQSGEEEDKLIGDPQIIKEASIHAQTSSFLTKTFLLRYYEEEVQLNDIVHFRIETEISLEDQEFILEVGLFFYDQQIKKMDPQEVTLQKGKNPKTRRYIIKNSKSGIHQFIPICYDGQYFSLANLSLHSICLDYRFRICKLQLYEFSRLSNTERKKLLQRNKKIQPKDINYADSIQISLKVEKKQLLRVIEELVLIKMKKYYDNLLKQYRILFSRSITEQHRQIFANILVHPNKLHLFEDQGYIYSNNSSEENQSNVRYRRKNPNEIIQNILNQTNLISGELFKLWHHYIDLIRINPRFATAHFQQIYTGKQQILWQQLSRINEIRDKDICVAPEDIDAQHEQLRKDLLAQRGNLILEGNIVSQQLQNKKKNLPLMIEDVYEGQKADMGFKEEGETKIRMGLHLVVLVHGFQGNSLDMKVIKNNFSLLYPEVSFLCASSNEEMTDTDIIEMGNRLSVEVKNHINEFFPPGSLDYLSFVGHSLGGVIIRAALPKLLEYKKKFHTLITFSSPHLGYKVNASSVIEAGIWFLQKLKNSYCLKQLTMADSSEPKDTCLYKISTFEGLKFFKNIFLFCSKQDSYAPYESARIEIHPDFMNAKDPLKQIHCQMVKNILHQVQSHSLHRMSVNFSIEQTNIDSIIGRTAHILFLQNNELIQMFLRSHHELLS